MKTVDCVKKFFSSIGLKWTGMLSTTKDKDFREANEEDFETLQEIDYLIDFGKDGQVALNVEIDLINFKINGESLDCGISCYPGDKNENKKLCKPRDLSKDWIKIQLMCKGLIYATLLRKKMEDEKIKIKENSDSTRKKLTKKIEYLTHRIENVDEEEKSQLKQISMMEKKFERDSKTLL